MAMGKVGEELVVATRDLFLVGKNSCIVVASSEKIMSRSFSTAIFGTFSMLRNKSTMGTGQVPSGVL